ncbi:DNA internalization-related competence protein ComEC/Rec2 [Massilia sp. DWR3-1-1]|uniref:DNA internalization-related competence protein ComEC/Rec2 n=1 Tax=Massilia sp. DWR3-1-1 TaxID=2804559 RepID=UPI003CEC2155
MRCAILGFAAGVAWLQRCASLPAPATLIALALAALVLLLAWRGLARARAALAGALLGLCWAALLAHAALAPQLAADDEGRDITVVGTIDSLPYRFEQGVRFHFRVEQVHDGARSQVAPRVPPRLALSWYAGFMGKPGVPVGDVQPGARWQLTVRLQRPHGSANPHGFDYEVWLLEQGLRATGYVRADSGNRRLDAFVATPSNLVGHGRAVLRARIERALAGRPYAGVIVALVVGDQRAIEQDDWQVFSRTGVSHLISISGLHITMVAGMVAMLASALWRRSFFTRAQLPLLLPAQKVAALAGTASALLYVLLAGFGVPAQRTLYMLSVLALALWSGRLTSISHVLCAALGLVLLLDPWAVLAPGFWLSFGAVGLILYASVGRTQLRSPRARTAPTRLGRLRAALASSGVQALRTQYVVTVGLVPLTLLLFAQVSLVSPLANALAIPVISFAVTPLALAGSLLPAPLSDYLLIAAHALVQGLAAWLDWLGSGALAVVSAPAPTPVLFAFALLGTAWLLAPRGWPLRAAGLAAWLPALTALPVSPAPGTFTATVFDVGQGMAVLIETASHRLLVDAGPQYSVDGNGGNRVIHPYLKARGIGRLDAMVISHSDADHAGGALSVLASLPVDQLWSSLEARHPIVRAARAALPCTAGQHWRWDGVQFDMLQPTAASYADASLKPNARSCTLRISTGSRTLLAAADIEAAQEAQLLGRDIAHLPADVLLAPHHGSGTSSTTAFLAAVRPSLAIFQVGYRNRYRHPKQEVWQRYGDAGIARLRTDESGAVTVHFGPQIEAEAYRHSHPRYWYGR